MTVTRDKDQVFRDYADFLKALLPQAAGFICYDRDGRMCWHDDVGHRTELSPEYQENLRLLIDNPNLAPEKGRVRLTDTMAYLAPLVSERGMMMGTMAILVDPSAENMPYDFCVDLLRPGLRSLQRELSLRYRLLDGYRKLNVQASEESLLHQLETLVYEKQECEKTLSQVLLLCLQQMDVDCGALAIPGRGIRIIKAGQGEPTQMADWLDELVDNLDSVRDWSQEEFDSLSAERDILAVPVSHGGKGVIGVLAFSGWARSAFSDARRRR
ncbi:MAG: hypothetical protein MI702_04620, partial [Chlorobiales bacterium]|nr:hypothetical protein [Chlorobiales bacterium]